MGRRTSAAVAKWLEKQEWYEAWLDNMNLQDLSENEKSQCINGYYGLGTIRGSIIWMITPEGDDYWDEINQQFIRWYNGNED